ncbi:MAG: hypothetical protein ACYC7A_05885 [Thermoanaerobaculia bacterium]
MNRERDNWDDIDERVISLPDVMRRVSKYKFSILLALGAIAATYLICAIALYVLAPSANMSELNFRLEFRGADRGEYPNGTKFSSSEIVSAPVLVRVFNQNGVGRYSSFADFKGSIFVVQANEALETLNREYRAKLADPKLNAIDRERIEREFQEKKASLSQADYSIAMATSDRIKSIPRKLRAKILSDILAVWAEQTVKDKGVSLYDISVLSSGIFKQGAVEGYDYIIALDLIRAKINRVNENIDALLLLPGAKVLRTGSDNASLAEIRVRLQDANDFRIRPLIGMLLGKGISTSPAASVEFLQTQLRFTELEAQEASARVEAVRSALQTYVEERQRQPRDAGGAALAPGSTTVIPQIDESFLDRIVQMTGEGSDLEYRQKMVDDLRREAMKVVPLEAEARYYRVLLESFRGSLRTPTAEEKAAIEGQIKAILDEAVRTTDQVNEIYTTISKDLNPSTILYSVTEPVSFTIARSISAKMLLLAGLLLLLVSLPLIVVGVLVYDRMKRDDVASDAAAEAKDARAAVEEGRT